jgi:putative transposase
VLTEASGRLEIEASRDRAGSIEPQIVRKRHRRLGVVDEICVVAVRERPDQWGNLGAFAEIYGASVSKETISRITDKVLEEMNDWAVRPLDGGRGGHRAV